jgi:adapter protein MecA 1/2
MEIEKINENQIKFVLTNKDLKERNIKISELAYGSEKTRSLFQEMMEQASMKYDFRADDTPLMIEAIPISIEIMIVLITKVANPDEIESRFNCFSGASALNAEDIESISNDFDFNHLLEEKFKPLKKQQDASGYVLIYSFDSLDTVSDVSKRITGTYSGKSALFKHDRVLYLILEENRSRRSSASIHLEAVLSEYGHKRPVTYISKNFLLEHGEKIIKENAIETLGRYL